MAVYKVNLALGGLHEQGIAHLDVKPANVIVTENGDIKLCDFGTATPASEVRENPALALGTDGHMAPEAVAGYHAHEKDPEGPDGSASFGDRGCLCR